MIFNSKLDLNTITIPDDDEKLIYTPVSVNGIQGWALLVCGAIEMFISKIYTELDQLQVHKLHGKVRDGIG